MTETNTDNINLNLNPARQDKFSLVFGNIPSAPLLSPADLTDFQGTQHVIDEKNYFHLSLRGAIIPSVSLGDLRVGTMFTPIAETDMNFTFEPLTTTILVDNNFIIHKLLLLWVYLIKRPDEFNQYPMKRTHNETAVTAILTRKDNFDASVLTYEFYELRPLGVPSIPLSYANEGDEVTIDVTWQYTYYMPRTVTGAEISLDL